MKLASNTGMMLLGTWLLLSGLAPLLNFNFESLPKLLSLLAAAAGVAILMNK